MTTLQNRAGLTLKLMKLLELVPAFVYAVGGSLENGSVASLFPCC